MVKILGHNHWKQAYFENIIRDVFKNHVNEITFSNFEAHFYPSRFLFFWKIYEKIMELIMPKSILAYNIAIIMK